MPKNQQNQYPNQINDSLNQIGQKKPSFNLRALINNKRFAVFGGIVGVVIIGLVIILIVNLFSQPAPVVPQPVTITFWTRSTDTEVIQKIIDGFEKENPLIKVKHEVQSETDYKNRTLTRLRLQSTNIGNIVEVDENWIDRINVSLSPISDSTILGRYSVASVRNNSINGATFAVPYQFDGLVFAYNQDHLAEINFTEEDFNKLDWTSLSNRASTLTKTKNISLPELPNRPFAQIIRSGTAIGSPITVSNSAQILQLLLIQNDAKIYDSETRKFILNDKFVEVMNFYTNFVTRNIWSNDLGNDIKAFSEGKVSIILVRSGDIDQIKKLNPNLRFGTAIPAKIGGIRNISLSKSLVLPNYMPNYSQSIKFIEYLTRTENSLMLFNSKKTVNTFVPAQITSLNQIPKTSPFAVFSDINTTADRFLSIEYDGTTEVINNYLIRIFELYGNKSGYPDRPPIQISTNSLQTELDTFSNSIKSSENRF